MKIYTIRSDVIFWRKIALQSVSMIARCYFKLTLVNVSKSMPYRSSLPSQMGAIDGSVQQMVATSEDWHPRPLLWKQVRMLLAAVFAILAQCTTVASASCWCIWSWVTTRGVLACVRSSECTPEPDRVSEWVMLYVWEAVIQQGDDVC